VETLGPESHQIREVYALYGLAMYQVQCVERQLAILLATEYGPGPKRITRTQFDELFKSYFDRTFGGVLRKMLKDSSVPVGLEERLRRALDTRNMLAHRYFWDRAAWIVSSEGRTKMLRELQDDIDFLDDLDADLTKISEDWAKRHGITQKDLDLSLKKLLESEQKET